VEFQFDGVLWGVVAVAFAPVVAHGVGEDVTVAAEGGGGDGATDFGVALETVLGVFVPEVKCAIWTCRAECAVDGVEGDGVDGVDFGDVSGVGVLLAVALEWEVETIKILDCKVRNMGRDCTYDVSLSSTYWIAHRPSMEPTANPEASEKQLTTLVCHFSGLVIVL
jgi:hypothetical protein